MSSSRKGYLLVDALISVLIVSTACSLMYASCLVHSECVQSVKKKTEEMEQEIAEAVQAVPGCEICAEDSDAVQ